MRTVLLPPPDLPCERGAATRLVAALGLQAGPKVSGPWTLLDTPDHRLARAGLVLVRRPDALVLHDAERVAEPRASQPWRGRALPRLLADWPAGPVRDELAPVVELRALLAVASVPVAGVSAARVDDQGKTIARCQAWLATPADGAPRLWLELTGLRGYAREQRALVQELLERGWTTGQVEPCAALRGGAPPDEAEPVEFVDGSQAAGAALTAWLQRSAQLLPDLERGVRDDVDTEFLHEYRVTLRKMRALTAQFKTAFTPATGDRIRALLGGWARASNAVRDLDVWLLERSEHAAAVPAGLQAGLEQFHAHLTTERAAAQRHLAERLGSAAHRREVAALLRLLQEPAGGADAATSLAVLAGRRIWKTFRRAAAAAATVTPGTDAATVHELRIRGKRLRYVLDACGALVAPEDHRALRDQLKSVQAVLGTYNDVAVQTAGLLQRVGRRGTPPAVLLAAGALVGALERQRAEVSERLQLALADFTAHATRARYRRLFRPPAAP